MIMFSFGIVFVLGMWAGLVLLPLVWWLCGFHLMIAKKGETIRTSAYEGDWLIVRTAKHNVKVIKHPGLEKIG